MPCKCGHAKVFHMNATTGRCTRIAKEWTGAIWTNPIECECPKYEEQGESPKRKTELDELAELAEKLK